MGTRTYHLATDHPEAPDDHPVESVRYNIEEYILPNTGYRQFDVPDDPPVPLTSGAGQQYIKDAFRQTQTTVEPALETIRTVLCNSSGTEQPDWETVLNDDNVLTAAHKLGQIRGNATFLYGLQYGLGIQTREGLEEHLETYGPSSSDETIVIVPVTLNY